MSDITIHQTGPNWSIEHKAWRYEFIVEHFGRSFSVPVLVSDQCPKNDRDRDAINGFRDWTAKVAEEAAKL